MSGKDTKKKEQVKKPNYDPYKTSHKKQKPRDNGRKKRAYFD